MLERGEMTEDFRTAKLRLIPKKGDLRAIGNWRSISLLSVFYKIMGGVIANRLKTHISSLTSISQKGFQKKRKITECILNINAIMTAASKRNKNFIVMFLDFSKAFDRVSRPFIKKTLTFYGFGNFFINCIETMLKNRIAYISLPDGKSTNKFAIETGVLQGDTWAPLIFEIVAELLLTKLRTFTNSPGILSEVGENSVEAYADDTSNILECKIEQITKVFRFTEIFYSISGLKINKDKTQVMIAGGGRRRKGQL